MRVGFVVYGDLENTSGGFRYDRTLVEHLRDRGDDVDVLSLPWRTYRRHLLDNLRPAVHRRLRDRYDVLLQDELCHPSLLAVNRRLAKDSPIVSLVHSLRTAETRHSRWNRLYGRIERRYLSTVDGVVCTSHATKAAVERLAGTSGIVAQPGCGHRSPSISAAEIAARARETPLRVVFVGNVIPRKGVRTLIDGLASLPTGSWRLTVVGPLDADPNYVARLRRRIDALGLEASVTLTGRLSDEELVDRLRRHHLLAVPSTYEAFGIVYLEGMGFGLPALATTAGGAREIVRDGENGFLVPPDDAGAVADAVGSVLDDRDRLREMGIAARETHEAHHSWTETGRRVRAYLSRIVDADGDDS